ncbi:hypothetical protein FRC02_001596 [Tulasnella sp. 418]|nr:hypothetical protein FRC02_001596 [Tulasnella sp. 418]
MIQSRHSWTPQYTLRSSHEAMVQDPYQVDSFQFFQFFFYSSLATYQESFRNWPFDGIFAAVFDIRSHPYSKFIRARDALYSAKAVLQLSCSAANPTYQSTGHQPNSILHAGFPYFGAQVDKRGEVAPPDAFNLGPLPAPQTSYARSIARKPPKHILEHAPHPPANQTRRVASVIEGL